MHPLPIHELPVCPDAYEHAALSLQSDRAYTSAADSSEIPSFAVTRPASPLNFALCQAAVLLLSFACLGRTLKNI